MNSPKGPGGGDQPNLDNQELASENRQTVKELRAWFDRLWADHGRIRGMKQEVLDALAHLGNDHAPKPVYYKG